MQRLRAPDGLPEILPPSGFAGALDNRYEIVCGKAADAMHKGPTRLALKLQLRVPAQNLHGFDNLRYATGAYQVSS